MPRKPKKGEKKEDYISYCMGADVMLKEYPDQKQRVAVCNSYWKKKSKSSERVYIKDVIAKAYDLNYVQGEVKDTIIVKFKLCHANRNKNGDAFTNDELRRMFQTAESKAITYGHNQTECIGYISKAVFIDTKESKAYACFGEAEDDIIAYGYVEGEDSYIYCEGVIWKNRFPDETEEIRTDFENAELFFSMEAYFTKCRCSACKCVFEAEDDYCEHLEARFNNGVSRILMDCTFTGVAKVTHPADRGAIGLSAAKEGFSLAELIPDDKFDSNVLRVLTELMMEDEIE